MGGSVSARGSVRGRNTCWPRVRVRVMARLEEVFVLDSNTTNMTCLNGRF